MKSERHQIITALIQKYHISTQREMAKRLTEAGYQTTQATVSRDIRQMKLIKTSTDGCRPYYALPEEKSRLNGAYASVLRESMISADTATNLLVLKTHPGMAMAAAAAVDALHFPEIVGTIAGDDTVMAAIRSAGEAAGVQKQLQEMILGLAGGNNS